MYTGFMEAEKKEGITLDDLAAMVARGFKAVDARFDLVDERFDGIDRRIDVLEVRIDSLDSKVHDLEDLVKLTRREMLDMGDRFTYRFELDNLTGRVTKLEAQSS